MTKFEDLSLRCDIRDDPHQILSRFCLGFETQDLACHAHKFIPGDFVPDVYQLIQDLEISLRVLSKGGSLPE